MRTNINRLCLGTAAITALASGIVAAAPTCWKVKDGDCSTGCGGTGTMSWCEEGCQEGSPGKDGSGVTTLVWYLCYYFSTGETAEWPCGTTPPTGWAFTTCPGDPDGNCCIYDTTATPTTSSNLYAHDKCLHGNDCPSSGGGPF